MCQICFVISCRTSRINPMDDLAFAIAQVLARVMHSISLLNHYGPFQFSVIVIYLWFIPILCSQDPETADLIRKLDIKKNAAVKGVVYTLMSFLYMFMAVCH